MSLSGDQALAHSLYILIVQRSDFTRLQDYNFAYDPQHDLYIREIQQLLCAIIEFQHSKRPGTDVGDRFILPDIFEAIWESLNLFDWMELKDQEPHPFHYLLILLRLMLIQEQINEWSNQCDQLTALIASQSSPNEEDMDDIESVISSKVKQ